MKLINRHWHLANAVRSLGRVVAERLVKTNTFNERARVVRVKRFIPPRPWRMKGYYTFVDEPVVPLASSYCLTSDGWIVEPTVNVDGPEAGSFYAPVRPVFWRLKSALDAVLDALQRLLASS